MVDNRNTANELSDDELREIAETAYTWYDDDTEYVKLPSDIILPPGARDYAEGVIAERLRHRAEGEGRDGLARPGRIDWPAVWAEFVAWRAATEGIRFPLESYLSRKIEELVARHTSAPGDGLARRPAEDGDFSRLLQILARLGHFAFARTHHQECELCRSVMLDEARAKGLLDEPTTHTTQPTTVPPIDVPALKVEHPALNEPHYWPWPNDQTARYALVHTVWRWLREQIGESREPATFTVINDEPAHPTHSTTDDSAALGAMERLLIGERSRR